MKDDASNESPLSESLFHIQIDLAKEPRKESKKRYLGLNFTRLKLIVSDRNLYMLGGFRFYCWVKICLPVSCSQSYARSNTSEDFSHYRHFTHYD